MAKIRLTESELRNLIQESVMEVLNEADMDEGWRGLKNMFGKLGGDVSKAAGNAWDATKTAVGNAKDAVVDYGQKLGQEYKAGNSQDKIEGITNQLDGWYNSGVFGQNRQVAGAITTLKDALKLTHNSQYQDHQMDMGDAYAQRQANNKRRRDRNAAKKGNGVANQGVA